MLALFGRAEARDFLDIERLLDVYSPDRLLQLAAQKDDGFTTGRFAESLAAISRLQAADFPGGQRTLQRLRDRFETWRLELTRDRGIGGRGR